MIVSKCFQLYIGFISTTSFFFGILKVFATHLTAEATLLTSVYWDSEKTGQNWVQCTYKEDNVDDDQEALGEGDAATHAAVGV